LCRHLEKKLALQELQQQLAELTANHVAAMEATKAAHCREIETLKESLPTDKDASAFNTAVVTYDQAAAGIQGSVDMVPSTRGLYQDSLLDVRRSMQDLAALYQTKCQHTAFLQSRLDTVAEFIAHVGSLDQSESDTAREHPAGDLCSSESAVNSPADILATVRNFALGFQQSRSDFPLQVENLQRVDRCDSRHVQLAVQQSGAGDEASDCLTSQLLQDCQLDSRDRQVDPESSKLETLTESSEICSESLSDRMDQLEQLKTAAKSENHSLDLVSEMQCLREKIAALEAERDVLESRLSRKSHDLESLSSERASVHQGECDASTEELQSSQSQMTGLADELRGCRESSAELETRLEASVAECADLKQQLVALSSELESCKQQYDHSLQSLQRERDSYRSRLHDEHSELEKLAEEICSLKENSKRLKSEIREKDEMNRASEAELQQLQAKLVELQKKAEESSDEQLSLKEDDDVKTAEMSAVEQRLNAKAAELTEVKEMYEAKTAQLSLTIEQLNNRLESDKMAWDAELTILTDSHNAALEAKDSEVAKLTAAVDSLKESLSSQQDELTSALQRKDEAICLAEVRHRSELAGVTERFEKQVSELESERCHSVEEHRERIARMEQSDVELNTQLIALTEKFNSVTEYMTNAEQLVDDYRSKVERLSAERDELIRVSTAASAELTRRDAELVALKEQIQLLKQQHSMPAVNGEAEMAAVINRDGSEPSVIGSSPQTSLDGLETETRSPNNTQGESVESLQLAGQVNDLQQQQQQSGDNAVLSEHVIEQLKREHRADIQRLEDQHNAKVVQLIKDFNAEMAAHEKELRETANSDLGL